MLYAKVFRSQHSSVNPYLLVLAFTDKLTNKSLLKVIRLGYNRQLLTQLYRFEAPYFVSNYNRNVYEQEGKSIQPLNKIITEAWMQVEVVSRLVQGYDPGMFFVLQ